MMRIVKQPETKHPERYKALLSDGTQMVVPINGTNYRVIVTPGPLLVRGESTASRVRHREKIIEVDAVIPASDRWRVAALAVAYACRRRRPPRFHPVKVVGTVD